MGYEWFAVCRDDRHVVTMRPVEVVLVDSEEQFFTFLIGLKWNGIGDAALFEVGCSLRIAKGEHFIAVVRRVGKVVRETHGLKV